MKRVLNVFMLIMILVFFSSSCLAQEKLRIAVMDFFNHGRFIESGDGDSRQPLEFHAGKNEYLHRT